MGQLLAKLHWSKPRKLLEALPAAPESYKVWRHKTGRLVQEASPELRRLQARIATLLRRVTPPEYRHSGVRGRSFLTNAKCHVEGYASIKTDIKEFYPAVTFQHVQRFFRDRMKCSGDVAFLLAKICSYQRKHLPTGGVHSEVLAFYCVKPCFDEIAQRANDRGGVMTVYVDDIMSTMPCASHSDLHWMRRLFARHGIELHGAKKSRVFRKRARKTITGVCINNGQLSAPQSQHLAIRNRFADFRKLDLTETERKHTARSLLGHWDHVQQIDTRFASRATGNRARLKPVIDATC